MYRKGIVSDWDISIPKLIDAIDHKEKIIAIERMTKRKFNTNDKTLIRVDTNNLMITYKGTNLPTRVNLYGRLTSFNIRSYMFLWYNCYRYGHFKQFARMQSLYDMRQRLYNEEPKCVNCGEHHKATF